MTQYFFVTTYLPPLQIGNPPEITFDDFITLLKDNLLPGDYAQTRILRRYYDILNIRAFLKGEELDPHGNMNQNELETSLVDKEGLPKYIIDFLETYKTKEERLARFPLLISLFFREEVSQADSFVKEYLDFERKLRLVLVGFRAKKLGRNLAKELQYEDPDEDLIAQILAQKDAPKFEPPEGFEQLRAIFEEHYEDPLKMHQALCEFRFEKIEQMAGDNQFSFRRVLAYLAQLIIVENWMELDRKKGLEIVDNIIKKSSE